MISRGVQEAVIAGGRWRSTAGRRRFLRDGAVDAQRQARQPAFDKERDGLSSARFRGLDPRRREHALARGAKSMRSDRLSANGDAYHMTAPAPEGEARRAAAGAQGWHCAGVSYINAHGTSTE